MCTLQLLTLFSLFTLVGLSENDILMIKSRSSLSEYLRMDLESQSYLPSFIGILCGGQFARESYILIFFFMVEEFLYKKLPKACFGHFCIRYSNNFLWCDRPFELFLREKRLSVNLKRTGDDILEN